MLARLWIGSVLLLVLPLGCAPSASAPQVPASNAATSSAPEIEPPLLPEPTAVQLASFNAPPSKTADAGDEDLRLDPVEAMINFDDVSEMEDELSPEKEQELLARLRKEPNNAAVLFALADFKQLKAGVNEAGEPDYNLFKQSADYLRRALQADPKLKESDGFKALAAVTFFNEARALSRDKQSAAGLQALRLSVDHGWNDLTAMREDTDLELLQKSPEFAKIFKFARDKRKREVQTQISVIFINKPEFEFDFKLTDTRGKPLAKQDFAGKLLIVNIWGTWCGPCRQELRDLIAASKKYQSDGVELVGINTEYEIGETAVASIRETQKSFGIPYRCALGDDAVFDQIPNFGTVPTTLFFNRQGVLLAQWDGLADELLLEMIIERLLRDSPPGTESR